MENENTDFISRIGELVSIDREEVLKAIEDMDVDTVMEILDAVANDDATKVGELMNNTGGNEAKSSEEQDVEDLNPLFHKGQRKKKNRDIEVDEGADDGFQPNIGDTVSVGDPQDGVEGVVKITKGPNGLVGVMIDGELQMVEKVHPLKEGVMGMTNMPGLQRMQELAGIMAQQAPQEAAFQPMVVSGAIEQEEECPLEAVMCLFKQIEESLPTLQIRDLKAVRERINGLMMKLNESRQARRPKL